MCRQCHCQYQHLACMKILGRDPSLESSDWGKIKTKRREKGTEQIITEKICCVMTHSFALALFNQKISLDILFPTVGMETITFSFLSVPFQHTFFGVTKIRTTATCLPTCLLACHPCTTSLDAYKYGPILFLFQCRQIPSFQSRPNQTKTNHSS